MRRWIVFLLLVAGSMSVLYLVNSSLPREETPPHTGRLDLDDDLGDENPAARAQYELERLRDPATGGIPPGIRQRELEYARTLPTVERLRSTGKRAGAAAVDDWTVRGPTNISGRTRALAYDVSDPDTWLAGGVSGGMWRTTNQGQSWTKQTTPGQLHSVTCITQDTRPGYADVWFYGTGEYLGDSASEHFSARYSGDGIYRSTDGGLTWTPLMATQSGTPQDFDNDFDYVWNIVTDPTAQGQSVVLAATIGGIFRSNDNGDNWTRVLGDGFAAAGIRYESDIAVSSQGVFYATVRPLDGGATEFGFYRSTDGVNWTRLNTLNGFRRSVLAIAPSDENEVFILAYTPSSGVNDTEFWQYTYVSGDGTGAGGTFTDLTANIPDGDGRFHFEHQRAYDLVVAVDPSDVSTVFIGGTSLFRSTDGFTTGTNSAIIGGYNPDDPGDSPDSYRYPNQHPDQHAIVFLPDGTLLTGHDGGVSHTTDPYANSVTWTFRNEGYVTTQFYSVATDPTTPGERMVVGGMQDNGGWVAPGGATDWSIVTAGDGMMTNVADGGSDYYTSSQFGRVYRSQLDASGATLQQARVDPCEPGDSRFFTPFLLDPADQTRMVLTAAEVIWRNGDITAIPWGNESCTGTNWTSLDNFKAPAGEEVTALAMPRNGGRLYFGTTDGRVFYGDDVMTTDPNPVEVTDAAFGGGYVSSITTDPVDTDRVYLTLSSYDNPSIFVSDDAGATWTDVGGNLEPADGSGPSVRWIDVFYDGGRRIYFVGTSTGLYSTDAFDGANTVWAQEGATSIGNVVVDMVRVRQDKLGLSTDGYVAVATHGNGIYDTFYPVKRVTGTITDASGNPVDGVVMNGLPGNPTTDASGTYEATMDWQWQGTATPSKPGYTFNPVERNYSGTPFTSKTFSDYIATPANSYAQVPSDGLELWLRDAGMHVANESQSGTNQPQVFQWDDQSGNSREFLQILPGQLPRFRILEFSNRGGVFFDGVDDFLRGGFSLDGAEEASVFLVFEQDGTQSGTYPFAMPEAESGLNGFDLGTGGVNRLRSYVNAGSFTTTEAIEDFSDPGRIVTARYWPPGILNTHRIYVNGKERDAQTNSGPIEAGANATFLGAFSDDYGGYFEGVIAEVLVYSRSLGRAERSAVENYLGLKYGLGWKTVAAPTLSSTSTGVYVLGNTGAAVNFTDPPSQSGSLSATTGTDPGTSGALPPGLDEVLPDQYWTVDAFLSDYGYSITVDLRDFDLSGASAFTDLTLLKRDDEASPWQYATGQGDVTLVHHEPYLTAAGLTSFSDFAIGVIGGTVNLTVSTETDVVDANGGNCAGLDFVRLPGPDGEVSLREAVCAANATSKPVDIGLPAGTYTLAITGTGEDANATGDLDVVGDLTLSGVGARSTVIDAAGIDRVLELVSGSLTLDGVTVTGGQAPGGFAGESGGGIRSGGNLAVRNSTVVSNVAGNGSYFGGGGGGIYLSSDGTLNVERSLVADNTSGASTNGSGGPGGGIWAAGPAEIVNSTLSGNEAINGGAIFNAANASLSVTNSVLSGNSSSAQGSGIFSTGVTSPTIVNSTLTGNTAGVTGGAIVTTDLTIQNSIVWNNSD
ncbi:MAG: hypothetical protein GVY18_03790, partial [Bacteroidetes bacterium]|nr:hypothetical protein [Bacteroidota bacterium]